MIVIISEILNSATHLLDLLSYYFFFDFKYSTNYTIIFIFKIVSCLSFLIFIRGGVPRYRYDFLTKIGWIKFLGYVIVIFLLSLILFIIL